jgi:hypothetical protein
MWRARGTNARVPQHACKRANTCARQTWGLVSAHFFFSPANAWGLVHACTTTHKSRNSGSSELVRESHIHLSPVMWRARGTNAHASQHACKRADTCVRQTWGLVRACTTQITKFGFQRTGVRESHIHVSPVVWRARGTNAHAPQHACKRTDTCARQTWGLVRAHFFFFPANAWGLVHAHQNSGSSKLVRESHINLSPVMWRARGTNAHAPQHACKRTDTCARQTWGLVSAHFFFFPPRLGARSCTTPKSKFGFQRIDA